jgi:hypothetical protein
MRQGFVTVTGKKDKKGSGNMSREPSCPLCGAHGWIKVKDRLPKDNGCVKILILDKGSVYVGYYSKSRCFEWWAGASCNLDKDNSQDNITHWKQIKLPE